MDGLRFVLEAPQLSQTHKKRPRLVTSCDNWCVRAHSMSRYEQDANLLPQIVVSKKSSVCKSSPILVARPVRVATRLVCFVTGSATLPSAAA